MKYHGGQTRSWSPGASLPTLFVTPRTMYKAFTGALALALALLVLHWILPELAAELVGVAVKLLRLVSTVLDSLTDNLRV